MRWKRWVALGLALGAWAGPVGDAVTGSARAAERRAVRIATEAADPPFSYRDQAGEPQGFEIDLVRAACALAELECSFVVREWDGMIRDLMRGEYEAIASSLAITPRRRARIAFTTPHIRMPSAYLGRREGPVEAIGPGALDGRSVGVVEGSPHEAYLAARRPEAEIRRYAKVDEAVLDLMTERLDLVLAGRAPLRTFLESREAACCRIVGEPPYDPEMFGEGLGIGIRKEDPELKARFDDALGRLAASGEYDRIRARTFPFPLPLPGR